MRNYAIVDEVTGNVKTTIQWGDDRDFPINYPIEINEKMIIVDAELVQVESGDVYNSIVKEFYILDVTDNELEIEDIKSQLSQLELVLSDFQEETWVALSIDETKLSQVWQDRLLQKRALRERLALIVQK